MCYSHFARGQKAWFPDDSKLSLLPDYLPLKLLFELLEASFCLQVAFCIWVSRIGIIIRFLSVITRHIHSWMWEDVIQRNVAMATA